MNNNLDGKKVKINYERFNDRTLSNRFRNFLGANKDKVFTAHLDIEHRYAIMYTLVEDDSPIKWLFEENDLIEV